VHAAPSFGAIAGHPAVDGGGTQLQVAVVWQGPPWHCEQEHSVPSSNAQIAPGFAQSPLSEAGELGHSPDGGASQACENCANPFAMQSQNERHSGRTDVPYVHAIPTGEHGAFGDGSAVGQPLEIGPSCAESAPEPQATRQSASANVSTEPRRGRLGEFRP